MRLANRAPSAAPFLLTRRCFGGGGRSFRGQPGGDVFRPRDFLLVAGALENDVRLFFSRGISAGLLGGTVGFLVLVLVESAAGAKTHAAAPAT